MNDTIVFRCNAGPTVGFGHLTRCTALARALNNRGGKCVMVGPAAEYASVEAEFCEWIPAAEWISPEKDAEKLCTIATQRKAAFVVLDDYRVDETYQKILKQNSFHYLQFDYAASKPLWGDIIVNASPAATPGCYEQVVRNPAAEVLIGPRYAILRNQFSSISLSDHCSGRQVEKVLVTFGGGDDRGGVEFVLSAVLSETPGQVDFVVVSGKHNPRNKRLSEWIKTRGKGRVRLLVDPNPVAPVFAGCDLAIMAGGTTTFEAACCGLPMVLMTIGDNQIQGARAWEKTGSAVYLGDLKDTAAEKLVGKISELLDSESTRKEMADKARKCIDGKGGDRVAERIMNKIEKTTDKSDRSFYPLYPPILETRRLRLRPMTEADGEIVVSWRNSDHVASMNRAPQRENLTVEKHLEWFKRTRRCRVDCIIEERINETGELFLEDTSCENSRFRPIGSLSFTWRAVPEQFLENCTGSKNCAELGKYIGEKTALGKGYGYEATACWIEYGFSVLKLECVIAVVRAQNKANIRINEKIGFSVYGRFPEAFFFEDGLQWTDAHELCADGPDEWFFMALTRIDWSEKETGKGHG